ncbi:kelch repeat-containing protein [Segetibacter koreensis]|uniref:kelch repeat-containing protein n=1 Tax=Segetibacter koreensis TaxID=398037 RepID=UPI0003A55047|nr:kelch repeat-containing protein [Segetibacter koreensis]
MKKFYYRFLGYQSEVALKFAFTIFILTIIYFPVTAQNGNDSISWSTVAGEPVATHEVHGEVVKGKLYIFGGYDKNKQPTYTPTKRSYVYDPAADTWSPIADLPHTPNGAGFGGITHVGLATDGTDIYFAAVTPPILMVPASCLGQKRPGSTTSLLILILNFLTCPSL